MAKAKDEIGTQAVETPPDAGQASKAEAPPGEVEGRAFEPPAPGQPAAHFFAATEGRETRAFSIRAVAQATFRNEARAVVLLHGGESVGVSGVADVQRLREWLQAWGVA